VTFNLSYPCSTVLMHAIVFGCSTIIGLDVNVHSSYLFLIEEIVIINLCANVRSYVCTQN